jgi:hypothetical protein
MYMWTIHMNVTKWVGLAVLFGYIYVSNLQAYDWLLSMTDEVVDNAIKKKPISTIVHYNSLNFESRLWVQNGP